MDRLGESVGLAAFVLAQASKARKYRRSTFGVDVRGGDRVILPKSFTAAIWTFGVSVMAVRAAALRD
jgi:hypothetical protein